MAQKLRHALAVELATRLEMQIRSRPQRMELFGKEPCVQWEIDK